MLSLKQLFYFENTSFDRLPLWKKQSKLINLITEEEVTDDWWNCLNPEICSQTNLNVIWSLMTDHNFYTNFSRDPFIADLNEFENLYRCADYLQIDLVCKKMCVLFIKNPYWGDLINAPEILINFIKTSHELLVEWSEEFFNEQIYNFWAGKTDTFEPRAWHPDLFYNTMPVCNDFHFYNIDYTWWHEFWSTLTREEWNEEKWQIMLPFLIKTNIFGLLTIFPLPMELCPVWSSTVGKITSPNNPKSVSTSADEMIRPEWVNILFNLSPYYFTIRWTKPNDNNNQLTYPLIVQFLACGMINYVEDLLDMLPWNWGHDEGKSIMDMTTSLSNAGPEFIHRLHEKGFRPTVNIFKSLLLRATVFRKFLTGWNYILSQRDNRMPRMSQNELTTWVKKTKLLLNKRGIAISGNSRAICNQMREICMGQIIKNVEDRQHRINILSLGRKGWTPNDELTIHERNVLSRIQEANLSDRNNLWHLRYGDEAEEITELKWCGHTLDDLTYTHLNVI